MNSKQLAVISVVVGVVLLISGCDGFRYAASESQKENAWLHERVCAAAAEASVDEAASEELCGLTALAEKQSGVFVVDYGLPEDLPRLAGTPPFEGGELHDIATQAKADAAKRPDVWGLADGAMELGIALAGLVGGVYGLRITGYLKTARDKSKALKEIIDGNELFKQLYPEQADRFKESQRKQSPATQQLVTEAKAG